MHEYIRLACSRYVLRQLLNIHQDKKVIDDTGAGKTKVAGISSGRMKSLVSAWETVSVSGHISSRLSYFIISYACEQTS